MGNTSDFQDNGKEDSPPSYSQAYISQAYMPDLNTTMTRPSKVTLFNAPKRERTIFLRKVYAVLLLQCTFIVAFISLIMYVPRFHDLFHEMANWKFFILWVIGLFVATSVVTLGKRKPPMSYIIVAIMSISIGVLLGSLSAFIQTDKVLISVGIVGLICICVILFTFQHHFEYTPFISFMYVSCWLCVAYGFLCIAFDLSDSLYIMAAPIIFFIVVVASTNSMIKDEELMIMSSEYCYAAVCVSMLLVLRIARFIRCCPCCCCCRIE